MEIIAQYYLFTIYQKWRDVDDDIFLTFNTTYNT